MNKRLIIIGLLILAFSVIGRLIYGVARNIKVDNFKPSAVIFVVDSSASNQKGLAAQKKTVRQICNILDPEDTVKILRVSEDAYLIYEGAPFNGSGIDKAMNAFTKYDEKDYGTAYGVGLKKAFSHALNMKKKGICLRLSFWVIWKMRVLLKSRLTGKLYRKMSKMFKNMHLI